MVDYILTVAVSVSAGTDAITSAFPSLHEHNVFIACILVVLITIINLRGVTESAICFSLSGIFVRFSIIYLNWSRNLQNCNRWMFHRNYMRQSGLR